MRSSYMNSIRIGLVVFMLCLGFAGMASGQNAVPGHAGEGGAKIILTSEGENYPAILHTNTAARGLLARLPVTLSLNRGIRDYCGDIAALKYAQSQVQNGYRNGALA